MKPLHKGLLLAALHLALISSLGAKLLVDRARLPRVWVKTASFDPDLPIRGRYVSLGLLVKVEKGSTSREPGYGGPATLTVKDGQLVAVLSEPPTGIRVWANPRRGTPESLETGRLDKPVTFFIPEHVPDPSWRPPDEELWVEVTVPKKGPPRPIRLGVKKAGVLSPLALD